MEDLRGLRVLTCANSEFTEENSSSATGKNQPKDKAQTKSKLSLMEREEKSSTVPQKTSVCQKSKDGDIDLTSLDASMKQLWSHLSDFNQMTDDAF